VKHAATFAAARADLRGVVGLVPTMGFLHEGHLSLLDAARSACDTVVMSLFVNPLQFDRDDDLRRYPRDLERDLGLAEGAGVDVVFAPAVETMYPAQPLTRVTVATLTDHFEGPHRPGHFDGVATVVAKLFAGLRPDRAFFGRKDAQQLAVVRRMAADLSFPIDVVGAPIVREPDGLALSSRNVFLDPEQRTAALALNRGLAAAADAAEQGARQAADLVEPVTTELAAFPLLEPEYVALASQDTVEPIETLDRPAFLAVAAWAGPTRLIDNVHLDAAGGGFVADRGVRLDHPSVLYQEG
jgi:pantoate--beta-alanine ligase